MALNSRSGIDPRWVSHNRGVVSALALATIEISHPHTSGSTYDAVTNSWSSAATVVWTGKARIQPRSSASTNRNSGVDPAVVQVIEVHIGLNENTLAGSGGAIPDIRPGYKIKVTASPTDQTLLNFDIIVGSVMNSSNPWHRMLLCEANQEMNPRND